MRRLFPTGDPELDKDKVTRQAEEIVRDWISANLPHSEWLFGADEGIVTALREANLLVMDPEEERERLAKFAYKFNGEAIRKKKKRNSVSDGAKARTYASSGGFCVLAGPNCEVFATTIDHWIPLAKGGDNCEENLKPACRFCNEDKGDKWPSEWLLFALNWEEKE